MILKQEITTFNFPEDVIIWDVRDAKNYAAGHVKQAVNKPIDQLTEQDLECVAKDSPIYILCGGGSKAPRAAEKLNQIDDQREYVILVGGTRAAKTAGLAMATLE